MNLEAVEERVARLAPRHALLLGAAGIAFFALLQILFARDHGWANLDLEFQPPALYGAGLDMAAGILSLLLARTAPEEIPRAALIGFGVLLVFMGFDELFSIHEKTAEKVDVGHWTVLYSPIIVVGGIGWLFVVRGLRRMGAWAWAFALGAACWIASQILERWAYEGLPGGEPILDLENETPEEIGRLQASWTYYKELIPEEVLEMTGSLLFAVALLCALRVVRRRRADASRTA